MRISLSDTFTSADLFLGDGGRIKIVSESHRECTSVDSSIAKGPITLRDSRGQNLAAGTRSLRDCIRPNFSERPSVREYNSDAKIRPDPGYFKGKREIGLKVILSFLLV